MLDGKSPGQPSKLNDPQRQAIAQMIESGPIPAVHCVVRWRLVDLAQWIFEEFRITIAKQTLSWEPRAMGYRKLSARPRTTPRPLRDHLYVRSVTTTFEPERPKQCDQLRKAPTYRPWMCRDRVGHSSSRSD